MLEEILGTPYYYKDLKTGKSMQVWVQEKKHHYYIIAPSRAFHVRKTDPGFILKPRRTYKY